MLARTRPRSRGTRATSSRRLPTVLTLRAMLRVASLGALRMLRLLHVLAWRLMLWRHALLHNDRALMLLKLWCEMLLRGYGTCVYLRPRRGRETIHMRLMHGRTRCDVCAIGLPVVTMRVVPGLGAVMIVPIRTHHIPDHGQPETHAVAVNRHRTTTVGVIQTTRVGPTASGPGLHVTPVEVTQASVHINHRAGADDRHRRVIAIRARVQFYRAIGERVLGAGQACKREHRNEYATRS